MKKQSIKNKGTMLEGVHFDEKFLPMRKRSQKKWKIDTKSKGNLERSITVVNLGSMETSNTKNK